MVGEGDSDEGDSEIDGLIESDGCSVMVGTGGGING
jgi:hypothetical protein